MNKAIWNSTEEWFYFLGNILVGVKVVFLLDCLLVLFLLKDKGVWAFLNKKKKISNRRSLLNNSIENNNIDKLDSQNKNIGFFFLQNRTTKK